MRRKKKDVGGRYTVESLSSTSLPAMTAYAAALAQREERDVFVREIGREGWLFWMHFDPAMRATTVIPNRGG